MSTESLFAIESIGLEFAVPNDEMTPRRGDITSTPLCDDAVEIITAAFAGASIQFQFPPRINVYENIPFAGGDGDYSILSVLFGAHSIGEGIFGFLTMKDSNKVRVQCVECRKAVKDFPWMDAESRIKGSVEAWRASFPCARAVNVSGRVDIVDADFVHIRGNTRVRLHTVKMLQCLRVTSAAFVHLRGIHTLDMSQCRRITDDAFTHLRGIHTLDMNSCSQVTITDAAFENLRGIHTLGMGGCSQVTITDAAFENLRGIHTLNMNGCNQITITGAALPSCICVGFTRSA
jgi:hypothetical protein